MLLRPGMVIKAKSGSSARIWLDGRTSSPDSLRTSSRYLLQKDVRLQNKTPQFKKIESKSKIKMMPLHTAITLAKQPAGSDSDATKYLCYQPPAGPHLQIGLTRPLHLYLGQKEYGLHSLSRENIQIIIFHTIVEKTLPLSSSYSSGDILSTKEYLVDFNPHQIWRLAGYVQR